MKLFQAVANHPEAVALGIICLTLGLGDSLPRLPKFANSTKAPVGMHQLFKPRPAPNVRLMAPLEIRNY